MNIRKSIIKALLHLSGSAIPKNLKQIFKYEYASPEELQQVSEQKLRELLSHAWENVPYYSEILRQADVVVDGKVNPVNFPGIPALTKDIIRREGKNLYSRDYQHRKPLQLGQISWQTFSIYRVTS